MRRYALGTAVTIMAATACARGMDTAATAPGDDPCTIVALAGQPLDTLHIALPTAVDPVRVLRPGNAAEATLVAALYGTLVTTDCRHRPVPALARSWVDDTTRTRWTFQLDPAATFADGTAVTAQDVAAVWSDRPRPRAAVTRADARGRIVSIEVAGPHTLTVQLDGPADATLFADPILGIRKPASRGWPIGTGPYEIVADPTAGRAGYASLQLRLVGSRRTDSGSQAPHALHFAVPPAGDLRNALDLGADLVLTGERAVIDYARALSNYASTPLPWDRTYLLLTPDAGTADPVPEDVRTALARDAVRAEARPARPLAVRATARSVADTIAAHDRAPGWRPPPSRGPARIVYQRGDDAARGLAERLVVLAAAPDRNAWLSARLAGASALTAHGLDAVAFDAALGRGTETGYVIGIGSRDLDASIEPLSFISWLPASTAARAAVVTPLVETRARAIHRTNVGLVRIDASGTLHFADPARPARR